MTPEQNFGQTKAQMSHAKDTIAEINRSGTSGVYGDFLEQYHALARKTLQGEDSTKSERDRLTDTVHLFIDAFGIHGMSKVIGAYFNHEVRKDRIQQESLADATRRYSAIHN